MHLLCYSAYQVMIFFKVNGANDLGILRLLCFRVGIYYLVEKFKGAHR